MRNPTSRLLNIARVCFALGIGLTAVLLPVDRLGMRVGPTSLLTVSLILLLPQALIDVITKPLQHWRIFIALGAVALAATLSLVHSIDHSNSLAGLIIFAYLLMRSGALAASSRRADIELFETVVLMVTAVVVLLGYLQIIGDLLGISTHITHLLPQYTSQAAYIIPRPQSTALEPLYLAHYLFLPLGIMAVRISSRRRRRAWVWWLLAATLLLFILTLSRGALLGLIGAGIIFGFGLSQRNQWVRRWSLGIVALAVGVSIVTVAVGYEYARKHSVTQTVGISRSFGSVAHHFVDLNDRSANTRYELWPVAVRAVHDHPVTGVGWYNSREYIHPDRQTNDPKQLQPLNNDYLAYLTDTGLLGALLALPLIFVVAWPIWKALRESWQVPWAPYSLAVVGMAIQATTFDSILLLRTWVVLGMLLAATRLTAEIV